MLQDAQIVIGPNASLSAGQAWVFMGLTAGLGLGIALGFAVLGFWPKLPFAGLELTALGVALWISIRRNAYREVLRFEPERIQIEYGTLGTGAARRIELPRHWTRVVLEAGSTRHAPTRLLLSSSGRRVEVGRCLTDEEREQLRARLRELLKPGWPISPTLRVSKSAHELPLGD